MLKDYIRALQTSFTTVTGLRDALIRAFKGVDEALEGKQDVLKSVSIDATSSGIGNIATNIDGVFVAFDCTTSNVKIDPWYTSEHKIVLHCTDPGSTYQALINKAVKGTMYYI